MVKCTTNEAIAKSKPNIFASKSGKNIKNVSPSSLESSGFEMLESSIKRWLIIDSITEQSNRFCEIQGFPAHFYVW